MPFAALAAATTPTAHIGLGLAAVGRPGYINLHRDRDLPADRDPDALRARTHELLDAAYAQGVRYVDTARSYGRAEEFLGEWLDARPSFTDLVVGSKWGYTYTADWRVEAEEHEVKDHSLATFERQYAETGTSSATGSASTRSTRSPRTARRSPTRNCSAASPPWPPTASP